jgi:DNA-binding LacI/PurR family transcriptional regulator
MTSRPKPAKNAAERMRSYRQRQRANGLRPVQFWVPDLRNPTIRQEIRLEAAMLSRHPDNAAIDAWIDTVIDSADWT